MGSTTRRQYHPRRGLTLIELLVVIAIVAGLAALLVLILPRLGDSQRASKGADIVQGQLFLAKQMALRDQLPRGVRFVATGNFSQTVNGQQVNFFDQVQLIEQPPAYSTGAVPNPITNAGATWPQDLGQGTGNTGWFIVTFDKDLITGVSPDFGNGTVLPGDYLDLAAANDTYTVPNGISVPGAMHLIMKVFAPPPPQPQVAWVLTQPQIAYTGSQFPFNYRIVRSPRPLTGQAPVSLPNGIVVDAPSTSALYAAASPHQGSLIPQDTDGNFEVLFDPSGKVLRTAGNQGKVVLWVKDVTGDPMTADQTLVAVYGRTGLITAQPVNFNPGLGTPQYYPYAFVQDGATSGM